MTLQVQPRLHEQYIAHRTPAQEAANIAAPAARATAEEAKEAPAESPPPEAKLPEAPEAIPEAAPAESPPPEAIQQQLVTAAALLDQYGLKEDDVYDAFE